MTAIKELQFVYQKPVDAESIPKELLSTAKVFATQGQAEIRQYAQVGLDQWVENYMDAVAVNIPVGTAGNSEIVRRIFARRFATMDHYDRDWEFFYCIAAFENADGSAFFRTIIPRTAIGIPIRNLRRGNARNRKHGIQPNRRVGRKRV
jgi:hypothetical protein